MPPEDEFTGKTLKKQELKLLLSLDGKENKGDKFGLSKCHTTLLAHKNRESGRQKITEHPGIFKIDSSRNRLLIWSENNQKP